MVPTLAPRSVANLGSLGSVVDLNSLLIGLILPVAEWTDERMQKPLHIKLFLASCTGLSKVLEANILSDWYDIHVHVISELHVVI